MNDEVKVEKNKIQKIRNNGGEQVDNKKDTQGDALMSDIKKCPGCNLRKRNLYKWFDEELSIEIEICEDCLFLRELEKELLSNLDDEDNQRVLIDYEAFGQNKAKAFPYRWLENYLLKAFLDQQEEIDLDKLISEWRYKEVDLEKDILPKFISWNIITDPYEKEIDDKKVKVIKFGSFLNNLFIKHLNHTETTGTFEKLGNILKLLDGRIGFGIEAKTSFKDHLRKKLMKLALKYGYDSNGKIKEEIKLVETTLYRCKICNEEGDFRSYIFRHISDEHPEIKNDEDRDNSVEEIKKFVGIKIPRSLIAELDEMKTYGSRWRATLTELFKKDAFFTDSREALSEEMMVISSHWAMTMEKVNIKVKTMIKAKEKVKTQTQ